MNTFRIFIPSKGRADNCSTAELLIAAGISNFSIAVEPQDYDAYAKFYSKNNLLMLPDNNRGLAFSRNMIKAKSIELGDLFHWQMDDDVKKFKRRVGGKNFIADTLDVIIEIENYVKQFDNIAIAGMNHEMFAWTKKESLGYNKQCSSVCLFSNSFEGKWKLGMIEDTDYSLQALTAGYCTVLFNWVMYCVPASGSQKGGLTDNQHLKRSQYQKALCDEWPHALKQVWNERYQRTQVAPSQVWKSFTQRPSVGPNNSLKQFFT